MFEACRPRRARAKRRNFPLRPAPPGYHVPAAAEPERDHRLAQRPPVVWRPSRPPPPARTTVFRGGSGDSGRAPKAAPSFSPRKQPVSSAGQRPPRRRSPAGSGPGSTASPATLSAVADDCENPDPRASSSFLLASASVAPDDDLRNRAGCARVVAGASGGAQPGCGCRGRKRSSVVESVPCGPGEDHVAVFAGREVAAPHPPESPAWKITGGPVGARRVGCDATSHWMLCSRTRSTATPAPTPARPASASSGDQTARPFPAVPEPPGAPR